MLFMLDNYDSFVYNLAACLREGGHEVLVRRADELSLPEIYDLQPEGIILSPGPKRPKDAPECHLILREFQNTIPILGVCLGHQTIAEAFGATVSKGARPMHGKLSDIHHDGTGLFSGLPHTYRVTRYHSLSVEEQSLPLQLRVNARSEDGVIMGIEHRAMPIYGVQFHPEAVLTQYGHELLENFYRICERWWQQHEADQAV